MNKFNVIMFDRVHMRVPDRVFAHVQNRVGARVWARVYDRVRILVRECAEGFAMENINE